MGVSRVDFGGETLVDLTGDTVTPQSLLNGYSAHNKAGELIEGLAVIPAVGNGTVTIKQNGANKGTFTMNQSGNTTIELTDNNTTYGAVTQSKNGLMTAADKKKLDGLTPTTSLAVTQQGTSVLDGTVGKVLDDKIDRINSNFGGCSFEQEGDDFYITGADAVRKKLGSFDIDSISVLSKRETLTFNSTSGTTSKTMMVGAGLILYKSLFPVIKKVVVSSAADFSYTHTFSFSYNTTTGVLTVSRHSNGNMLGNSNATVDVYYFLPE